MKQKLLILIILLSSLIVVHSNEPQKNDTIIGKVIDINNQPISFCYVYFYNSIDITYSDINGYFKLPMERKDIKILNCSIMGYLKYSEVQTYNIDTIQIKLIKQKPPNDMYGGSSILITTN